MFKSMSAMPSMSAASKYMPSMPSVNFDTVKNNINMFIPSSLKKPLNTFMDLLDDSYKLKNTTNPSLISNISTLLTQITVFIKQKVIEMNLSGLAKSFFDNLISLILLIGIIISYTRGGKMTKSKKYKSKKSKKHRKTRRY